MSDLISRCELFSRLATVPAPSEANSFKAEVYKIIQSMEPQKVLYICNRKQCDDCFPECELTSDPRFAASDYTVVVDRCHYPVSEKEREMLKKRNKVERMTIANTLLTSIYEELLKGETDDIDGLLQIAAYAQVEMNRIVFELNHLNGCEPTDCPWR